MRISTETGSIAYYVGTEEAVRIIGEAGFDAFDLTLFDLRKPEDLLFGDECLAMARRIKQIGLEHGIVCNQTHAPYPSTMDTIPVFEQAIRCTAEAGGEICVIHPISYGPTEESVELYRALLPTARECGVKISTENLMGWRDPFYATGAMPEQFKEIIDAVNDPLMVGCLDIGHAEIRPIGTGCAPVIHTLGKRLQALHIHDNDLARDSHALPFTMNIDFDAVIRALHEVGYSGDFTLEALHYILDFYNAENVADGVRHLATVARDLACRFEQL